MYHKYELEFPNSWQDILNVAETKLTGELEYRRGNLHPRLRAIAGVHQVLQQHDLCRTLGLDAATTPMLTLLFSWSRVTSRKQPGPTKKVSAMPTHFLVRFVIPTTSGPFTAIMNASSSSVGMAKLKSSNFSSLLHSLAPIYQSSHHASAVECSLLPTDQYVVSQ